MPSIVYIARLIGAAGPRQTMEFEALDDQAAWRHANDDIYPLAGLWVEVTRKADPQVWRRRRCRSISPTVLIDRVSGH